jgi:hypothetical protein
MKAFGYVPDKYTYHALLLACAKTAGMCLF